MGYASKDIRNILVAGHAGCGKTTLTEALLYMSGATERMGRVEDGTTATFTMQEDVGVLAKFSTLEEDDSSADFGTIAAATAVVGVVGATAYFVGTEVALNQLLPAGTSVPQDRAQLALLLWNTAGRPEPAALPAFADVTDPDTAKAAQWCMEAGFFQPREDGNFKPGKHVSRWKVLRTYPRIVK